ncbi:MAG: alpha/beta hydrolase [Candidatus Heimdallarchaeota archaeon]|nr:alpha/beta hydrolase [Candidatus Heimdallarchaeota archaeon]
MAKKKKDLRAVLEKQAEIRYFEMYDGTKVRVLDFNLAENPSKYELFFIPGFITVFQSWQKVLEILTKEFRVYYFESREKCPSIFPNRKIERKTDLHKMAHDIKEVIDQLKLDGTNYITVCSSTGGTIEVEALSEGWLKPKGAVMVGPTIEFHIKWFIAAGVSIVPEFIKWFFMPFTKWVLGRAYVDKKAEPEQFDKYVRALEEGKLRRMRRCLRQMRGYKCWDMLPKINTKCLLIGASKDKMHATEETIRTSKLIPNSKYLDLGSNKAAHEQPLIDAIKDFITEIENEEKK